MNFGEVMKRLENSGIGGGAEVVEIRIEPRAENWMAPPPAPGTKQPEGLVVVVRA